MKPACEVIVQHILPGIRALIARDLIERYGLTQYEAAKRLGMTQPAISQYKQELRGTRTKMIEPVIGKKVSAIAKGIVNLELDIREATKSFCSICRQLRRSGTLCKLHKSVHPAVHECTICID